MAIGNKTCRNSCFWFSFLGSAVCEKLFSLELTDLRNSLHIYKKVAHDKGHTQVQPSLLVFWSQLRIMLMSKSSNPPCGNGGVLMVLMAHITQKTCKKCYMHMSNWIYYTYVVEDRTLIQPFLLFTENLFFWKGAMRHWLWVSFILYTHALIINSKLKLCGSYKNKPPCRHLAFFSLASPEFELGPLAP